MGDGTGIEWTDATWNPLRGCTAVSEGCRNCYAAGVAARFSGPGMPYDGLAEMTDKGPRWTGIVREVPEHLGDPLRWRKPRRVFVNSMSDLFHPSVSNEFIAVVFGVMAAAPQHTFQVLTKRPERMAEVLSDATFRVQVADSLLGMKLRPQGLGGALAVEVLNARWPLPNVWLGTSVEDQRSADARIPALCATPAVVRFLSMEPLLAWADPLSARTIGPHGRILRTERELGQDIHWVIVGGESGHGARPMDLRWARDLRDQCRRSGIAYFFKQVGAVAATTSKKGGTDDDIPADLRIREFPKVSP